MSGDFVERARELLRAGNAQDAVRVCRLGLLGRPDHVAGRLVLAEALALSGRTDEAHAELKIALARDPHSREALALRARLAGKPSSTPIGGVAATSGEFAAPRVEVRSADVVEDSLDLASIEPTVQVTAVPEASGDATLDDDPRPLMQPVVPEPALYADEAETRRAATPVPTPPAPALPPGPGPSLALIMLVVMLVGGGTAAGFYVRAARLDRDLLDLAHDAERFAAEQTYVGHLRAEAALRSVARARNDDASRAALRRLRAAIVAEFGAPVEEGEPPRGAERAEAMAQVYLSLAAGDGEAAVRGARALAQDHEDDAEAQYLLGRALAAHGDAAQGAAALERSARLRPRPLTWVALAEAHAALGAFDAAGRALDEALRLDATHPGATIARARLLAASGKLPPAGELETRLRALIGEAAGELPRVSPAQAAWAALALAEVDLARGDVPKMRQALDDAARLRPPRDLRFGAALVAARLAAGQPAEARAESLGWAARFPALAAPRIWLARVALAGGAPDAALAELDRLGPSPGPDALIVRGEAQLALANRTGAARDLDRALAARPGDPAALVLRARVDLDQGDLAGAARRLEAVYRPGGPSDVTLLYAQAMRRLGDRKRAAALIGDAEASAHERKGRAAALTEKARLLRDEGDVAGARAAIQAATAADPTNPAPRIEAATLAFDLGDSLGARSALDKLAGAHPDDPVVLLETARIHAVRGDRAGAERLLEEARRRPTAPAWLIAREAGRLALLDGRGGAAAALLGEATSGQPDDGEARLLHLDALIASAPNGSLAAAQAAVLELGKDFAGRAEADLARGRLHLAKGEAQEAVAAFVAGVKVRTAAGAPPRRVSDAKTWLGRGQDYVGDLDGAMTSYAEAARLDPSNARAHHYLGLIQLERGQVEAAHDSFERAVASNAGLGEAYFHLGETGAKLKKPQARQALVTYLKILPDGEHAIQARLLLRRLR